MKLFSKRKEQINRFKSFLNINVSVKSDKKTISDSIEVCPNCKQAMTLHDLENNYFVCDSCNYHFPIGASERIKQLVDKNSFVEMDGDAESLNEDDFINYQHKPVDN